MEYGGDQMSNKNDEKSFWSTLPGILTGIAAIITAIGGLIIALNVAGIITITPETPAPTPTITTPTLDGSTPTPTITRPTFNITAPTFDRSAPTLTRSAPIPIPKLVLSGTESYTAGGKHWVRYSLSIENWAAFPAELFEPAPDLPPCGLNQNASRTWVEIYDEKGDKYIYGYCALSSPEDLTSIGFAVEQGISPPNSVYVLLKDRRQGDTYRSNVVSPHS